MQAKKVYWAGDLFNFKDLLGNRVLADRFNQAAQGRWLAVLPQESESNQERSQSIRDDDLELLFSCDAVVANFDGTDLDSGTVVEFCFAKFLDLPTVLLRTDFRRNGDQAAISADPWNLMCSHYPRTGVLWVHSMKEICSKGLDIFLNDLASQIVAKLDETVAQPPISSDVDDNISAFQRAIRCAGGSMAQRFPKDRIAELIQRR